MSSATGSLTAWSKLGAYSVRLSGNSGSRSLRTSVRNEEPSNVKAAPRRACAVVGSGIADSCARDRW